ncbi:biotin--protein ligase-like [Xenia sp. Carnegie-2017]|uniref:biotin--protein ligase-like n=1 Tax=Xenia sp. Carnegie-2017 TaxID=2897299 RepID=UPI001F044E97|nr:biotin--protein ligase-like [Xenia sp. Carnegie-2017]
MFLLPYATHIVNSLRLGMLEASTAKNVVRKMSTRPPNVLIYTGKGKNSSAAFQNLKDFFGRCLNRDKYVLYQLKEESILREPWQENTEVLIVVSDLSINLEESHEKSFEKFFRQEGKLLVSSKNISFCDNISLGQLPIPDDEICFTEKVRKKRCSIVADINTYVKVKPCKDLEVLAVTSKTSLPVIIQESRGKGILILSTVTELISSIALNGSTDNSIEKLMKILLCHLGMMCEDVPECPLTPAMLLVDQQNKDLFLRCIQDLTTDNCFHGNGVTVSFTEDHDAIATVDNFPVITNPIPEGYSTVKFSQYKELLKTKHLGHVMIYTDVITSTQTIVNGSLRLLKELPHGLGVVVIARQQTVGKGRGGNAWLSPDGCLSFSFPLEIELNSNLGQRLPFVQHIAALAIVDAVRDISGYQDLDFRIKWPNDIYFGNKTKIGGILVNSIIQGRCLWAVIGIGINVDNHQPTTCINEIIEQHKLSKKISKEELLARILNKMEELVEDFQLNGPEMFLQKYYSRWLHSESKVRLDNEDGEIVTIKGLDDMGFLCVVNDLNEVKTLQPDGNSFDMMKNLITVKTRK